MAGPVSRAVVQAFYTAFASRDPERIRPFVHDQAEWMIVGPIDVLRFCGQRHGKSAVMELFESVVPGMIQVTGFDTEILLVDGDRAASFSRVTAVQRETGRTISYRCSHFLRFHDGQVIELRSVIDSFDAAEQVLGHQIELTSDTGSSV
jgi:ketosteroid isomerase-like protein